MRHGLADVLLTTLFVLAIAIPGCSKQPPQQVQQPSPRSSAPAGPVSSAPPAAAPASAGAPVNVSAPVPTGPAATEKHSLSLTNYANVPVTATLNGAWIGQWDSSSSVPLDSVMQGKNELKIDVPQQPDGEIQVEVNAQRNGQTVNLLRLNFGKKPAGSYTYYFAAR